MFKRGYILTLAVIWAAIGSMSYVNAAPIDIGSAAPSQWSLLSFGGNTVTVNNESVIRDFDDDGNDLGADSRLVGIQGAGSKLSMSGNSRIGGKTLLSDGTNLNITDGNVVQGGIFGTNLNGDPKGNSITNDSQDAVLNQAAIDARYWSEHYAGLTSTINVTEIVDSLLVVGGSGQNVLNVTKLELGGNEILTLDGQGNDSSFVINVFGDLKLNSGKVQLTGGLTFEEVLFNVIDGKVAFSGGGNSSVLQGTLMALDGEMAISPGLIQGTLIGGKISLVSGADLDTPGPTHQVSEPRMTVLFAVGFLGIAIGYRRRAARIEI